MDFILIYFKRIDEMFMFNFKRLEWIKMKICPRNIFVLVFSG